MLGLVATTGALDESQLSYPAAPSPPTAGKAASHQERPGFLKLLGGTKKQWETHRGGVPPLGLWSPARTLREKLGSQVKSKKGRIFGL